MWSLVLWGGNRGRTVPDADLKLLLLDALDVAAEQAGEHLAHHPLEHGGGGAGGSGRQETSP